MLKYFEICFYLRFTWYPIKINAAAINKYILIVPTFVSKDCLTILLFCNNL